MKWYIVATIILVIIILIVLNIVYTYPNVYGTLFPINRDNVTITAGNSAKFSNEEIQAAMDVVMRQFPALLPECELTDLWYDEKRSDDEIRRDDGVLKGTEKENTIVLLSNFYVSEHAKQVAFPQGTRQIGWKWILVRISKNAKWRIADKGYG